MRADQVKEARKLFEEEVSKLTSVGMPLEDAKTLHDKIIPPDDNYLTKAYDKPILSEDDDKNIQNDEKRYELHSKGQLPSNIVGLELPQYMMSLTSSSGESIEVPAWQRVLTGLAEKLTKRGVESTRDVYNFMKAEQKKPGAYRTSKYLDNRSTDGHRGIKKRRLS